MKHIRTPKWIPLLAVFLALTTLFAPPPAAARGEYIMIVEADGAIVPAMESYLERAITQAKEDNAELIIIQLDTPGGSVEVTENIIQLFRESEVPIVVYVSPSGAMAASAGALITFAGHQSAMAPNTVIGASSVINADGSDIDETARRKAENILLANVRTLTENRPPEAQELAARMITDADAVSVSEAYEIGLIDYIATDVDDLIRQLDGQTVSLKDRSVTLSLNGLPKEEVQMNFLEEVLMSLTNPTLVFLFLSLGGLLLVIEFRTPGGFIAGTLGVFFLLLSFYGLGILPINLFGIAIIALAFVFFAIEIIVPETQGLFSIVGGVLLAIGGLLLFGETIEEFGGISTAAVLIQSGLVAVLSAGLLYFALRQLHNKDSVGSNALIGMIGEARSMLTPQGKVFVNGEWWTAETMDGTTIRPKEPIRVIGIEDMRLKVEAIPFDDAPLEKKKHTA